MLTADRMTISSHSRWSGPAAAWGAASILLLALYWRTFASMVALWGGSDIYAHAYVVPPISLWLMWRQRQAVLACTPAPAPRFLYALGGAALVWLIGDLADTNVLMHFAALGALIALVPLILGVEVAKLLAFPLGFLFFAVPFGEALFPVMMNATADFTVAALRLSGIPVYREGLQFVIPSGSWSVIEGCSGLRYMVASVMVGSLFGYLNFRSQMRRLAFFGVSILVPLVANWVRAYLVVLIGHLSSNELATGVDHIIAGWVFFGVIMLLMFTIGGRFSDADATSAQEAHAAPRAGSDGKTAASQSYWRTAAAAGIVLVLASVLSSRLAQPSSDARPVLAPLSSESSPWHKVERPAWQPWAPEYLPPAAALTQWFSKGEKTVGMYLAYYRNQGPHSKLVSYQNQLVLTEDLHWNQVSAGVVGVEVPGQLLKLNTAELRATGGSTSHRMLVWQVYWVNGRWTRSDAAAKAFGVLNRVMGRGDDGASLLLFTDKGANSEQAQALLADFLEDNLATIDRQLQQTGADAFVPR